MQKELIAVDGSECSARAVEHALQGAHGSREPLELHVLNVQPPVTFRDIGRFVSHQALNVYYDDEGASGRADAARFSHAGPGLPHRPRAHRRYHHRIRARTAAPRSSWAAGLGSVSGLLLGSVAAKVLRLVEVPLTLVK